MQAWEQRAEKVAFAKRVFAEQYRRTHGTALDLERLTREQLVLLALDYAEDGRPYRRRVREAIAAGACPFLAGSRKTQLQGVLRVFERTFFSYVVGFLPEEHRKRWEALDSNSKSLQGFCKSVVPNPVERATFFAQMRKAIEARARDAQMGNPENSEASESSDNTAERSNTPIDHVEMDENGYPANLPYWVFGDDE